MLGIILYNSNEGVRVRLDNAVSMKHPSVRDRVYLWRSHWAMFSDNPLLGVGMNMTEKHIQEYHLQINGEPSLMSHAHNNFLQVLSNTGFIGFVFFLWFTLKLLIMNIKGIQRFSFDSQEKGVLIGYLGAFVCLHISGLTEANFFDGEVLHLFIFLTAYSLTSLSKEDCLANG